MQKQSIKYLIFALIPALFCFAGKVEASKYGEPNILILLADDMGYSDPNCYGGVPPTPNINSLANEGILFTNFYAAAPNCSPSRAGLLTGKSPAKVGMYNYRPPDHPMHLSGNEITIAELLKRQGYQTVHLGKWHLGCLPQDPGLDHPQPNDQGFDYSFGTEDNAIPSHLNPTNFVRNGEPLGEQKGYSCQILADEAIDWLKNQRSNKSPFFMYVAFHEPHARIASPPELVDKYKDYPKNDAEYLANIENLDLAIGKILQYLDVNGLAENTLVLFASDNGGYRQASNGNLRAKKSWLYEGGIRVPGIIRWPALNRKGVVVDEAAGFVDIKPTICDILNIVSPDQNEIDGTSILNLLTGGSFSRIKPLYWFFYRTSPEIAMRINNYMILGKDNDTIPRAHPFNSEDMAYIREMDLMDYELYNLVKDTQQYNDIIDSIQDAGKNKNLLDDQLKQIQQEGYYWKNLPGPEGIRKLKTEWVKYKRN